MTVQQNYSVQNLVRNKDRVTFSMSINPLEFASGIISGLKVIFNDPDAWMPGKTHRVYQYQENIGNAEIFYPSALTQLGTFTIREVLKDGTLVCDFTLPISEEHGFQELDDAFEMQLVLENTTDFSMLSGFILTLKV